MRLIRIPGEIKIKGLQADRPGKIDGVGNRVVICRIDSEKFVAFDYLNRLANSPVNALASLPFNAHAMNGVQKGLGAAVKYGQFQLIDSQKNVVMAKQRIVSRLTICKGKRLV